MLTAHPRMPVDGPTPHMPGVCSESSLGPSSDTSYGSSQSLSKYGTYMFPRASFSLNTASDSWLYGYQGDVSQRYTQSQILHFRKFETGKKRHSGHQPGESWQQGPCCMLGLADSRGSPAPRETVRLGKTCLSAPEP